MPLSIKDYLPLDTPQNIQIRISRIDEKIMKLKYEQIIAVQEKIFNSINSINEEKQNLDNILNKLLKKVKNKNITQKLQQMIEIGEKIDEIKSLMEDFAFYTGADINNKEDNILKRRDNIYKKVYFLKDKVNDLVDSKDRIFKSKTKHFVESVGKILSQAEKGAVFSNMVFLDTNNKYKKSEIEKLEKERSEIKKHEIKRYNESITPDKTL